jgi:hypothetical protein
MYSLFLSSLNEALHPAFPSSLKDSYILLISFSLDRLNTHISFHLQGLNVLPFPSRAHYTPYFLLPSRTQIYSLYPSSFKDSNILLCPSSYKGSVYSFSFFFQGFNILLFLLLSRVQYTPFPSSFKDSNILLISFFFQGLNIFLISFFFQGLNILPISFFFQGLKYTPYFLLSRAQSTPY